jgi:hypothetical protein
MSGRAVERMQSCVVLDVNLAQNGLRVHLMAQVRVFKKAAAPHPRLFPLPPTLPPCTLLPYYPGG